MSLLDERFSDIDQRLAKALVDVRNHTGHMGVRGNELAEALGDELLRHLVDCDSVYDSCEIQDTHGNRSQEIDLVMLNRFHPKVLVEGRPRAFYIEGVLAAAEVKTVLNKSLLNDCLAKARTFKRFVASVEGRDLLSHNVESDDWQRYLLRRPFFAFAYECNKRLAGVKNDIETWIDEEVVPYSEQIDAVFILGKGVIFNLGAGIGVIEVKDTSGDLLSGFVRNATQSIAAELLLWLSTVCPRFTALDPILLKYGRLNTGGYTR